MRWIIGVYLVVGIGWSVIKDARRSRKRNTLARLGDTPFFRCVTDAYYRAGKLQ